MNVDDTRFLHVELESNSPSACSPTAPDGEWTGIVIAAPKRVGYGPQIARGQDGAFALAPICGVMTMDIPSPPTKEPMILVARELETGKLFEGPIHSLDESPQEAPPDEPPIPAQELAGMTVTSYFHHNLAAHLPLPAQAAKYRVEVRWRGRTSNSVEIEFVEQP